MKPRKLVLPALIATAAVLPLMLLEWANTSGFATFGFPAALYIALWIGVFVSVWVARHIYTSLRSGHYSIAHPAFLLSTIVLLVAVAFLGALVSDQMPCFMGVPNCD